MARRRRRRSRQNDKLPYYIVGALVLIFLVVVFPQTGMFRSATQQIGTSGEVIFECLKVVGSTTNCISGQAGTYLEEDDVITAKLSFNNIKDVAGIDFKLKTDYDGDDGTIKDAAELTEVRVKKACIIPYYECLPNQHWQCDDGDASTIDTCYANKCKHVECTMGSHCTDTTDEKPVAACVDNSCKYYECNQKSDCDDNDETTSDFCSNKMCVNTKQYTTGEGGGGTKPKLQLSNSGTDFEIEYLANEDNEDEKDTDGDGIPDSKDKCPKDPSNDCPTAGSDSADETESERTLYEGDERCDTVIEPAVGQNYGYVHNTPFDKITNKNNVVTIQQDTNKIENYHISKLWIELDIKLLKKSMPSLTLEDFNIFDKTGDTNIFSLSSGGKNTMVAGTITVELKDTDSDGTPDIEEPEGIVAGESQPFYKDPAVWSDDDGDLAGDGEFTNDKCPNTDCGLDESNCLRDLTRGELLYGCAENQIDDDGDGVLNMILGDDRYMHVLDQCSATNWLDLDDDGIHDNAKDDLGNDVTFDDTTGCTSDATFMVSQAAVLATDIVDRQVLFTDAGMIVGLESETNTRCTKTRTTTRDGWKDIKEDCADFTLNLQFTNEDGTVDESVTTQLENNDVTSVNVDLPSLASGEYLLKASINDATDQTEFAAITNIPVRVNMGDVDKNGEVSVSDILNLQRAVEGYGAEEGLNLDINLDGEDANSGDLIKLKNIFLKR